MAKTDKPNILIIWGDDIGWFNVSFNNNGIMGYRTPNIDRIAKEGCNFTDWYGQQSCTAGRAAFIRPISHPDRSDQGRSAWRQPRPDRAFLLVPAQEIVGQFLATFREFPPRQRPASFSIDQALEKARQAQASMATSGGAGVK